MEAIVSSKKIDRLKSRINELEEEMHRFNFIIDTLRGVRGLWIYKFIYSELRNNIEASIKTLDKRIWELNDELGKTKGSLDAEVKKLSGRREHIQTQHMGDSARICGSNSGVNYKEALKKYVESH
jgi:prefoldin subunit 5